MAEIDLRSAVLDLLRIERANELEFVANLTSEERAETGTPEQWSAKDVLAHITAWRLRTADRLRAALEGRDPPARGNDDEENADIFAAYSQRSWQDVEADADRSVAELADLLPGLAEADLTDGQRYSWNQGRPLLDGVLGNGVEHPTLHLGAYCREHGATELALVQQERLVGAAREVPLPPASLGIALYNLACTYTLTGFGDQALAVLLDALKLSPPLAKVAQQDPDLDALRELAVFQAMVGE